MAYIEWDYYDIYCHKKRYQVLIPREISQFWMIYYPDAHKMSGVDIDFIGNRKGLEALRNACTALSKKDNIIVYFPCKKNNKLPMYMYDYIFGNPSGSRHIIADFVLMKPNAIKMKDWKGIRKRIFKMKSGQWGYDFPYEFKDAYKKEKYLYRKEVPKMVYRFDTIFFNALWFEYPDLAHSVEEFLDSDLENIFQEDIKAGKYLTCEDYLWLYQLRCGNNSWYDFETGIFFWDNDIYQKVT